jgi:hypothetical protein
MTYISEIFAGLALGIAAASLWGTWYLYHKTRKHMQFMLWNLGARMDLLEQELDKQTGLQRNGHEKN